MKLKSIILIVACAAEVLLPQRNYAQGVMAYLDNTSQPIGGTNAVGPTGFQIQTGTNGGGYFLNDIQLLFADATGTPNPAYLFVLFCVDFEGGPGNAVAIINASNNPSSTGLYSFAPPSAAFLNASTPYWLLIVVTGGSSKDNFNLSYADTTASTASGGWLITGNKANGEIGFPMFSINATPVPEPSILTLFPIGVLISFGLRRYSSPNGSSDCWNKAPCLGTSRGNSIPAFPAIWSPRNPIAVSIHFFSWPQATNHLTGSPIARRSSLAAASRKARKPVPSCSGNVLI